MKPSKTHHDYTADPDGGQSDPRQQFHVFTSSYAYGGGCGGKYTGMESFPHMLAALEDQMGHLLNYDESDFDDGAYAEAKAELEAAIQRIRERGSDKGEGGCLLSIDGTSVGYSSWGGYWPDFVPHALDVYEEDLKDRLDDSPDDDSVDEDDDDEVEEWTKEEQETLQRELDMVRSLKKRTDFEADDFMGQFLEIASACDERHL